MVELAILRTFTRTAIHIPALHQLQRPYEVLTNAGEFAYFATLVLVVPALLAIGIALVRQQHPQRRLIGFGVAAFIAPWILVDAGLMSPGTMDGLTMASVCAIAIAIAISAPTARALPVMAFALAFTASAIHTTLGTSELFGSVGQPRPLLNLAEVAALAYALSTPLLLAPRSDRRALVLSAAVGGFVFLGLIGNGSTSRFLLLWNAGLSGTFPAVVYAAAAAALAYSAVASARSKSPFVTTGILLLVAGGIGLHSTYQSALVLAGLASFAVALGDRRSTAPEDELVHEVTLDLNAFSGPRTEPS